MNSARIFASVSKYAGIVLCAASIGVPGVALTLPSAAGAAQASKPVARKATNKYVRKVGKPALGRVAKTSPKRSKLAAIKSSKQQVARQTPRRATQMAGIAVPGFDLLQVASIRPGAVYVYGNADQVSYRHSGESRNPEESRNWTPAFAGVTAYSVFPYQDSDFRTDSLNSAPQMAVQHPDETHSPRKAAAACLVNGEVFLLADCNTEPGAASDLDSHFGIGKETTAVRPADHLPLPPDSDAGLPAANADLPPPEPS